MTTSKEQALAMAVRAAVMHCLMSQHNSGSWNIRSPRVSDTALACIALALKRDDASNAAVARARAWLTEHGVEQLREFSGPVERLLWALAVDDTRPVELDIDAFEAGSAAAVRWSRLVMAIALYSDRAVHGGPSVETLRESLSVAGHNSSSLEETVAYVLTEAPTPNFEGANRAVDRLAAGDRGLAAAGSRGPIHTSLALMAQDAVAPASEAARRHRSRLLVAQQSDGTWGCSAGDVRSTALTLRALREDPAFVAHARPHALAFLLAAQNDDGGWPLSFGTESDSSTTGLVLTAFAGLELPDNVVLRGLSFLGERQTTAGLWTVPSAHGELEAACEETTSHVVAALRQYPEVSAPSAERARAWLADRARESSPVPHQHRGQPYAAYRTADALGWSESLGRAVALRLLRLQNNDGGWSHEDGGASTPSATGIALAALGNAGVLDPEVWQSGTDFILRSRRQDGSWSAEALIAEPRPLWLHCPAITQSFTALGLQSGSHAWEEAADGAASGMSRSAVPPRIHIH
ncbi:hypothetical protein ACWGI8_37715 [Streptomyces sp. NPDC054841]